ncbi:MAG: TRAP transporter small permease subunit [Gammaproteobacteria bacterium]|nr:TRAP transporter small permease subunit [Gammaproteobacteria bacterium]
MVEKICNNIDALNERVGRLAAWLVLVMVFITFLVVVLRYGFNFGRISLQESTTYLHAFVFMLAGAYTLKHNEHVRVDIFYQDMFTQNKAKVDLFGTLFLLLPFAGFIFWVSFDYVLNSWKLLEGSREAGGLPFVYILKTLIPLMAIFLFLQAISLAGRAWLKLKNQ